MASLSWNGGVLTSGCRDGSIHHHDVRVARHKVMELNGHTAEVCGLSWRSDGQLLASGGNDNVVNCWDGRIGQSVLQTEDGVPRGTAKWTKRNHTAAVKVCSYLTKLTVGTRLVPVAVQSSRNRRRYERSDYSLLVRSSL